jgi:hypothetical protein
MFLEEQTRTTTKGTRGGESSRRTKGANIVQKDRFRLTVDLDETAHMLLAREAMDGLF